MKKLMPDFKTIADFRKDNVECIKKVFRAFVALCDELGLFGKELVSVDGSKFKAVNGRKRNFNRMKLEDRISRAEDSIERYLKEKIERVKERLARYQKMLEEMDKTGMTEISLTDQESRLMKTRHGPDVCYNVHTAVDSRHKLIAEYEVTNSPSDSNTLAAITCGAKAALSADGLDAVADKGYYDVRQLKDCVDNGIMPYVPRP